MWGLFDVSWSAAGFLTFIVGATALCYDLFPSFRYHFKFVTYIFTVSCIAWLVLPITLFRPKDVRNALLGAWFVSKISTLLGISWEIQGAEELSKDMSSAIVVANHQSILDYLGMNAIWPTMKRMAAVSKREVLYIPPFGWMCWLCGTVFIDRSNHDDSKTKLSSTAESIHQNKAKLWIFPEGTRSKGATLGPFKKGAFHIAVQNKLPIIPIVISPYSFINDDKKIFNSGKMIIKVLPEIDTSGYTSEDVTKLTKTTQELMETEFQRLCVLSQKTESEVGSRTPRNQTIFTMDTSKLL